MFKKLSLSVFAFLFTGSMMVHAQLGGTSFMFEDGGIGTSAHFIDVAAPNDATLTSTYYIVLPNEDDIGKGGLWYIGAESGSTYTTEWLPAGTDGQVLAIDDDVPTWTTPASSGSGLKLARKTADETSSLSTAFQDDDHLIIPLEANKVYEVRGRLNLEKATTTETLMDVTWTVPSGSTMDISFFSFERKNSKGNRDAGGDNRTVSGSSPNVNNSFITVGNNGSIVEFSGLVMTGTTAGDLTLQWRVEKGADIDILTNSYMTVECAEVVATTQSEFNSGGTTTPTFNLEGGTGISLDGTSLSSR